MKKILLISSFLLIIFIPGSFGQNTADTSVFLITCGPGTETYSIYGHSALRVIISSEKYDSVYNWGIFDFGAPNFAWNFAKGKLAYWVDDEPVQRFVREYFFDKRWVISQKINLNKDETARLIELIHENLKPENKKYKYDFFYDDCSTRIRDLLEKSIGDKLLYPPAAGKKMPTFRAMTGKYQSVLPWLNFGIDLIMGSPGEKKASVRDQMFLPLDMKALLSESVINRSGKMTPLLQNPIYLLDFDEMVVKQNLLLSPVFVFTYLLIAVVILSSLFKSRKANKLIDISVYSIFSILAIMIIFFNFFTDHPQMKMNLNILWLNPVIIICLVLIILKNESVLWFRILFIVSALFLVLHMLLPQAFNIAILPLVLILVVRSSVRADYSWNPLSIK
jgi:hypothetical protein